MADDSKRAYQLHSSAVDDGILQVAGFNGVERISLPFQIDLDLVSTKADIDGEAMLASDVWMGIKQPTVMVSGKRGVQLLQIHGVLASFEQLERTDEMVHYRAVLVPRLWRLSLTRQSRIFQDQSVVEIVKAILQEHAFEAEDFDFRTSGRTYPKREYVVQYQESDLAFISRLLEHDGIFYHFEHGEKRSTLVFGDQAEANTKVAGASSFNYRSRTAGAHVLDTTGEESIFALSIKQRPITGQVILGDYNYRSPDAPMYPTAEVDSPAAFGHQYDYGDHFKDDDEGKVLANVRCEEIACRKLQFHGSGDARGFRAGGVFNLAEHYRADVNIDHLITEVAYQGAQDFAVGDDDAHPAATYTNTFITIPASVVFRPLRLTPKPIIAGTIIAKVDAAGDGQYAELDDQGRYKLKFTFDRSDKKDGKASRFVRMAQPYAGDDMGMHFPLHKGTEVIVTHVNGDPDRPLIAASVPNPQTGSKVTDANQSQSMIRSGGGNSITMEDTAGAEGLTLNATFDHTMSVGNDSTVSVTNNASETVAVDKSLSVGSNDTQSVGSNRTITIGADESTTIGANQTLSVGANKTDTIGANRSAQVGANESTTVGGNQSINVGGNADLTVAATAAINAANITIGAGGDITLSVGGSSITIDAGGITLDAIQIKIKGGSMVEVNGPAIKVAADGQCEIGGALIDVKASGPLSMVGAIIKNNS
jgi:type VI secretion system secreted protein VgrG